MTQKEQASSAAKHAATTEASAWVQRFASLVPAGGEVLDLACGGGRHSRLFLDLGYPVLALDRDLSRLNDLISRDNFSTQQHDLEDGRAFPLAPESFAGTIVTNYLYRPILPDIVQSVAPGGILIYETFARGNERFGRPSNPDFLLKPGELLDAVAKGFQVLAYEDLIVDLPKPAAIQRICARRNG